jgi:ComF family protein
MNYKLLRILTFIFPQKCKVCGAYADQICVRCSKTLKLHKGNIHLEYVDKVFVLYMYDESMKEIIHKAKYESEFYVIFRLLKLRKGVIKEIKKELGRNFYIVPIPYHPFRWLNREYNLSEKITDYLKYFHLKELKILKKIRNDKEQKELSRSERLINLKDSFKLITKKLINTKSPNFLLVDDVLTTGSTLNECAKTIKEGIPNSKVCALVIASNQY